VTVLNPTQGSLLGFLADGPATGWDLLQRVAAGLQRFWNVTPSHVYRELKVLDAAGYVEAGAPGPRDRRPYAITDAGRAAFREWIEHEPGPEQIRMPLLVTLWFGKHLDDAVLDGFLVTQHTEHEARLALYLDLEAHVDPGDRHVRAVIDFGIAYERACCEWLTNLRATHEHASVRRV
jgi:DNA-binding PadR family transcriptional regulator